MCLHQLLFAAPFSTEWWGFGGVLPEDFGCQTPTQVDLKVLLVFWCWFSGASGSNLAGGTPHGNQFFSEKLKQFPCLGIRFLDHLSLCQRQKIFGSNRLWCPCQNFVSADPLPIARDVPSFKVCKVEILHLKMKMDRRFTNSSFVNLYTRFPLGGLKEPAWIPQK